VGNYRNFVALALVLAAALAATGPALSPISLVLVGVALIGALTGRRDAATRRVFAVGLLLTVAAFAFGVMPAGGGSL
jgi:hypothetical protein